MERFENWMSYSYDGVEYGRKHTDSKEFTVNFNKKISKPLPSYKEALFNNAKIMREMYNEPFDVCLSGGIDSEVVVRTFKELGIKHNTFIFRLENNYNYRDVQSAIELCTQLNVPYHVIDFNIQHFFKNEAYELFQRTFISKAARLPRLKWIDMLDNIPIFGDGEPYWIRENENDFSTKSEWKLILGEEGYSCSIYGRSNNRTVIGDWYEYTAEPLLSYNYVPIAQKLLNDEIPGKLSCYSSRSEIHKHIWPDIIYKPKLVGYEGIEGNPGTEPRFITEFQQYMNGVSEIEYRYTVNELENLLLD
jgi:hypothetical protein